MGRRIRHIQRYRDIIMSLSRNGFGFIIEELGLSEILSYPKRLFWDDRQELQNKTAAERVRLFLEELGPTFVKIGQIASTRRDIIPSEFIKELEKLQDKVPHFSFAEVKQIIEQELGESIEEIFTQFHETPLAAASIGQVHGAVVRSGESVAVKIQRPGIRKIIETDLEILQDLALLAEKRVERAARYHLRDIVDEFARSLRAELDYKIEGRNAEKISKQFNNNQFIRIPKIYWDYTTSRVLTIEYLRGDKLNELTELKGYNCQVLAERFVFAIMHQILIEGFFHGDPHPGNVLVLPGGVIAFLDFGLVGRLTPELKNHVASLVIALMQRNSAGIIKAITRMGLVPDDVNMVKLRSDVDQLREKYYDVPLSQISLGESVNDLFFVARQHKIRMPVDLTLLGKTLLIMEGLAQKLDPNLSIITIAEPFGHKLLRERYDPRKVAATVWHEFDEYKELLINLPKGIDELTHLVKMGKLHLEFMIPELDQFLTKLDRISNRISFSIVLLSFSIIMMGLIIGSSLVRQSTLLWNMPAIEIGFGLASLLFIWLLYAIFKSGRF